MKNEPKVGDYVSFPENQPNLTYLTYLVDITYKKKYKIFEVQDGNAIFIDDAGDRNGSASVVDNEHNFTIHRKIKIKVKND